MDKKQSVMMDKFPNMLSHIGKDIVGSRIFLCPLIHSQENSAY